jgi:hypothetical protein
MILSEDLMSEGESQLEEVPRRSQRTIRRPHYYGYSEPIDTVTTASVDTSSVEHYVYSVEEISEPGTIENALSSTHGRKWRAAADSEYHSLIENDTWNLVELPKGRTAIGCKWILKVKHNGESKIVRFKSRLVAKGYSQRHGIDFDETYSTVVRFSTNRTLLAFAVQKDMIVHQMDVVTAFLNEELNEKIYMQQTDGYKAL